METLRLRSEGTEQAFESQAPGCPPDQVAFLPSFHTSLQLYAPGTPVRPLAPITQLFFSQSFGKYLLSAYCIQELNVGKIQAKSTQDKYIKMRVGEGERGFEGNELNGPMGRGGQVTRRGHLFGI